MLFRLRCGRLLEFAAFGAPLSSKPSDANIVNVLYHHGWPSTRHEAAFLHPHALELGVRVIAINRPGVGRSSHNPAYSFPSVVDDIRQLLDELGLQRVVFMGASGGGPYACACACLLPERTSAVCLMAGMTHTRGAPGLLRGMALSNRLGYLAINHAPVLAETALGAGTALLRIAGALGLGPMAAARRQAADRDEGPRTVIHDNGGGDRGGGQSPTVGTETTGVVGRIGGCGGAAGGGDGGGGRGLAGADVSSATDPRDSHARASAAAVTAPPAGADAAAGGTAATPAAAGGAGHTAAGARLSAALTSVMLMAAGFPAVDRAAVSRYAREHPELADLVAASGGEVAAQGLGGLWQDMRLTSEPWGLPLDRIEAPTFIWQGDADVNVTPAMARHLEAAIPGARGRLRLVAGAGHISLGLEHGPEALREVVAYLAGTADKLPAAPPAQ